MGIDILIIGLIYAHPEWGYWIIFVSLLLAGFHLPISEDLMILTAGVLASAIVPEHLYLLWATLFVGAYISDWIAYWTGRLLGPKLLQLRWFKKFITQERLNRMHSFYEKWGIATFIVGRFVPFGVRNCLFISAGMGKISFPKFLFMDGIASFISTSLGFWLSYSFGHHWHAIFSFAKELGLPFWITAAAAAVIVLSCTLLWIRKRRLLKAANERNS